MRKVLLVDDNPAIRYAYAYLLGHLGWPEVTVLHAGDGDAAIAVLREHPDVRVVLTDVRMPGMTGLDLVRLCRADAELQAIPIITMSGDPDEAEAAAAAGAHAHLAKPFELDVLRRALCTHLAGRAP